MVQSSDRISLWWAVMGSRVNAAGTEVDKKRGAEMQSQLMIQFVDSTLWWRHRGGHEADKNTRIWRDSDWTDRKLASSPTIFLISVAAA